MKKVLTVLLVLLVMTSVFAQGGRDTKATAKKEGVHTVALANINEKGVFGKLVKLGFQEAAARRGWNLVYVDNNADGQTAVSNAEYLALRGDVEMVVNLNVDQSVGQTIMDILNEAEIGVIAVDIALPGAPFYGIDSGSMGTMTGEWMADWVKKNWGGECDYVVLITQIASGDEVQLRVRNTAVAMKNAGIKIGQVVEIEGENDASIVQRRMTDFLTAHPRDEKIIVFTINENAGVGAQAAAETSGREKDVRIVSANCNADFTEMIYATKGQGSWFATNGNFPHLYGEETMQLMERVFAGEKLEGKYPCSMIMLTYHNIAEHFPLDNLPWAKL